MTRLLLVVLTALHAHADTLTREADGHLTLTLSRPTLPPGWLLIPQVSDDLAAWRSGALRLAELQTDPDLLSFTDLEEVTTARFLRTLMALDSDGDGLPDDWELEHGGALGLSDLPVGGSGLTYAECFAAGLAPAAVGGNGGVPILQVPPTPSLTSALRKNVSTVEIKFPPWGVLGFDDRLVLVRAKDDEPWEQVVSLGSFDYHGAVTGPYDDAAPAGHTYRYVLIVLGLRRPLNGDLLLVASAPSAEMVVSDVAATARVACWLYDPTLDAPLPSGTFQLPGMFPPVTFTGAFARDGLGGTTFSHDGFLPRGRDLVFSGAVETFHYFDFLFDAGVSLPSQIPFTGNPTIYYWTGNGMSTAWAGPLHIADARFAGNRAEGWDGADNPRWQALPVPAADQRAIPRTVTITSEVANILQIPDLTASVPLVPAGTAKVAFRATSGTSGTRAVTLFGMERSFRVDLHPRRTVRIALVPLYAPLAPPVLPKVKDLQAAFATVFGAQMNMAAEFTTLPAMTFLPDDDRNHDHLVGYEKEMDGRFAQFALDNGYEATIFFIGAGAGTRSGGYCPVGGGRRWAISDSTYSMIVIHELGHHFGLEHAFEPTSPCCTALIPDDQVTRIMGYGLPEALGCRLSKCERAIIEQYFNPIP